MRMVIFSAGAAFGACADTAVTKSKDSARKIFLRIVIRVISLFLDCPFVYDHWARRLVRLPFRAAHPVVLLAIQK